jgi:hypothetical protein
MIAFHANHVSVTREDWGYLVVWSADDDLASEQYLMLQAQDSFDEQDVRLGMNDVYIETCGQGWSWYGNIDSFELAEDRVRVQLSGRAAARMGNDGRIQATFVLDALKYQELKTALKHIFRSSAYYREVTV